jgi:hypothetical protein
MVRFDATASCPAGHLLQRRLVDRRLDPAHRMDAWTVHVPAQTLIEVINTIGSSITLSVVDTPCS